MLVVNNIEVLPKSPPDYELRRDVYRVIFEDSELKLYAVEPLPSIHIIVKNGNVTLTGVVNNESDMAIAGIRASGVSNVFSVDNQLQVANETK